MEEITFYRCEDCDKNYKTYQGLYNHNKRNHLTGTDGDMTPLKMSQNDFDEKGYKFGKFGRTKAGESVKEKREKKVLEKVLYLQLDLVTGENLVKKIMPIWRLMRKLDML